MVVIRECLPVFGVANLSRLTLRLCIAKEQRLVCFDRLRKVPVHCRIVVHEAAIYQDRSGRKQA